MLKDAVLEVRSVDGVVCADVADSTKPCSGCLPTALRSGAEARRASGLGPSRVLRPAFIMVVRAHWVTLRLSGSG